MTAKKLNQNCYRLLRLIMNHFQPLNISFIILKVNQIDSLHFQKQSYLTIKTDGYLIKGVIQLWWINATTCGATQLGSKFPNGSLHGLFGDREGFVKSIQQPKILVFSGSFRVSLTMLKSFPTGFFFSRRLISLVFWHESFFFETKLSK